MDIKELRNEIDVIDDQIVKLFGQRMDVASRIAEYKKKNNMPIFVPAREREKLQDGRKKQVLKWPITPAYCTLCSSN